MIHDRALLQNGHIQESETGPGYKRGLWKCTGGVKKAKSPLELERPSRARQRASASAQAKKGQTRCGLTAKQGS